jgi:hypothetical protein
MFFLIDIFIWVVMRSNLIAGKIQKTEYNYFIYLFIFHLGKITRISLHLCVKWNSEQIIPYLNNTICKSKVKERKTVDITLVFIWFFLIG